MIRELETFRDAYGFWGSFGTLMDFGGFPGHRGSSGDCLVCFWVVRQIRGVVSIYRDSYGCQARERKVCADGGSDRTGRRGLRPEDRTYK